jgi:hypothetical protein
MSASCFRDRHRPCPEHGTGTRPVVSAGHDIRSHAGPSKPAKHLHRPDPRSHVPALAHSAGWCPAPGGSATAAALATSPHARALGHTRAEQSSGRSPWVTSSAWPHPRKHAHTAAPLVAVAGTHAPCPEQ